MKKKLIATFILLNCGFAQAEPLEIIQSGVKWVGVDGTYKNWMHTDVKDAWKKGYRGTGSQIITIDSYNSDLLPGNLTGKDMELTHGAWTSLQSKMIATHSNVIGLDWNTKENTNIVLNGKNLNIINASYAIYASPNGDYFGKLPKLHNSVVLAGMTGKAIVVKAAGNDAIDMGGSITTLSGPRKDVLNDHLKKSNSVIFVGALESNGGTTDTDQASLASYSNKAGLDVDYQKRYLVVGVDTQQTGLAGTSFAAPIVSGYAAIMKSKFIKATPKQITGQLLNTARTDTIKDYSVAIHGKGEASLSRALAPVSLK
jgi:subtilisin family serine protease